MIVKMKKLTLLLYHGKKDAFLRELQDLGVVHVVENPEKDTAGGQDIATLAKRSEAALKALRKLKGTRQPAPSAREGKAVLEEYESIESRLVALEQEIQVLAKEEATLAPWGEFDPELVRRLASRGAALRFFKTSRRKYTLIDTQAVSLETVASGDNDIYFMVIGEQIPPEGMAEEVLLPGRSLGALRGRTAEVHAEQARLRESLAALSAETAPLERFAAQYTNLTRFQSAALDLKEEASGTLLSLNGWLPARKVKAIEEFLERYPAWYEITDPEEQDDVPVLVENGPFSRLFEPIMRLYMLPSYREMDPTPLFAPFFTFFVGLCLGDVAYGTIILGGAAAAYFKAPRKYRSYASLGMILGGMIIFCGVLLNSCFGHALFGGPGIPEGTAFISGGAQYFSPLSPLETSRGTEFPAMSFALVVGFIQLTFALMLQFINRFRLGGMKSAILPLSYMMMMVGALVWAAHANPFNLNIGTFSVSRYAIGPIILKVPEIAGKTLTYGGIGLLVLFSNPGKKIFVRPLIGLWDLYNFVTGNLGYLLSYIRLFALGLCSGLLGATFNQMALGLITADGGGHNWLSPLALVTVLILIMGHALNFGLSLVGAFVHPLRLTFVEFYQTLQFSGGGKEFVPFSKMEVSQKSQA